MSEKRQDKGDSKKILTLIVLIATIMITTTGGTYAYFAISESNNNVITGTAAAPTMALTVEKIFPLTSTAPMVPQLSYNSGDVLLNALNGHKCVDTNNNVVCHLYAIKIQNTGTGTVEVNGRIKLTGGTYNNLKWHRFYTGTNDDYGTAVTKSVTTLKNSITVSDKYGTKKNGSDQVFIDNVEIAPSTSKYFSLAIWIEEMGYDQGQNGTTKDQGIYTGTISFVSSNGTGVTSTITGAS